MKLPKTFDLPRFPWDTLAEVTALAQAHPDGAVDLTIGSPADSVAAPTQQALAESADAHGYPPAVGAPELREAIVEFMRETRGVDGLAPDDVVLTIGSKELVASLAFQLGIGAGDAVGFPEVAYPTYEVGAILAGAKALRLPEDPKSWPGRPAKKGQGEMLGETGRKPQMESPKLWPTGESGRDVGAAMDSLPEGFIKDVDEKHEGRSTSAHSSPIPRLVWLNSPGNPNGHAYSVAELREAVAWARANRAILVADECYALLDWEGAPRGTGFGTPSLLDESVTGGNLEGLLVTHSLSKQNNLAGYRAAWICGDPELVAGLREVRKHWGLMVPGPVQAAMRVALADVETPRRQKEIYRTRREKLMAACEAAGLEIDSQSVAGLYLWVKAGENGLSSGYAGGQTLAAALPSVVTPQRSDPPAAPGRSDPPAAPGLSATPGRELARWFAERGIRVAPGDFYGPAGAEYVRISLTAQDEDIDKACKRLA